MITFVRLSPRKKRYLAKGVVEYDIWVEFDASEIPAGLDEYKYARDLLSWTDMKKWHEEEPLSGDFRVTSVDKIEE